RRTWGHGLRGTRRGRGAGPWHARGQDPAPGADGAGARRPGGAAEIYPGQLPDLFAGEELVIFGRYSRPGNGAVRISGR
ncbi:hypothetical protein DF186_24625, partial [Enterococcus hirae]